MPDVFVSYTPQDKPIARQVAVTLQGWGVSCRSHSMPRCQWLLLVHSPHAAASDAVQSQVAQACNLGLTPVVVIVASHPFDAYPHLTDARQIDLSLPDDFDAALRGLAALFGITPPGTV